MQTTINNHIQEVLKSNEYMTLYNSDNKMLINYLKDLKEKLLYLKELTEIETKFKWNELENIIKMLQKKDPELTHINICFELKDIATEKKEARLIIKI